LKQIYKRASIILWVLSLLTWVSVCGAQAGKPLLLRSPAIGRSQIVFSYAGDLWSVGRDGGEAKRLTSGVGVETDPCFSPDGTQIAFTGEYDGNIDVYVIPASGGIPRRLTYHPAPDLPLGWTPDGKRILFVSGRDSATPVPHLFTISKEGGQAEPLPLPTGVAASYDATGSHLAYVPTAQWQRAWKRYHGGQTTPIWIADLATSHVEKVPRANSNDSNPMWIGDQVYFLSDRSGPVTLFAYNTSTKKVRQLVKNDGLDIKSASAGAGAIVYEQFGALHVYDLTTSKDKPIAITISGDMPEVRPHYENVAARIANVSISPSGARAVVEARGEILTVPAEKGSIRNLTNTPGVMERSPAWSPDGKWIAYFSDESGEYALHLRDANGKSDTRKINLGSPPSFFYDPIWSPDSKKIAYTDKRLNFWYVDIDKGIPVKIDTDTYLTPYRPETAHWSSDSRWVTYVHELKNHLGAVFVYNLDEGKPHQITDGMSDSRYADFDKGGKYLYFTASTNSGPSSGWLDMSSINHPITRAVYVVVLRKDLPSPLAPESDEEKAAEAAKPDAPKPDKPAATTPVGAPAAPKPAVPAVKEAVKIDLDGIGQRILALPIPAHNYIALAAGKAGAVFLLEGPQVPGPFDGGGGTLHRFDLSARKLTPLGNTTSFDIAANGEKMLIAQGPQLSIVSTATPITPGTGALNLSGMEVMVDPVAEWKQMYREVWHIERDFFYDPGLHGLNLPMMQQKYASYLDGLASRADLNYLFEEMLGEITVGHMFIGGGETPHARPVRVGLLGADYKIENGRYRFARVYNGENWNPNLTAPLTQPGVNVQTGEYLLAVNGRDVRPTEEVYKSFEATAGKQITLKVGPNPDGSESREVIVVPVDSENGLRNLAWIEDNRRKVDELSGGRVAYVYLPDTANGGYTNFNRYYFAQVGKEGAVIDERFNGGGLIADYIIDYMRRPLMGYFTQREGEDYRTPVGSIYGPKAMIINEYAGSGGDAMPWMFRHANIGPLVGKRTWGGLVGIFGFPQLMDGGSVTAPNTAFWNPNGTWDVENHGVEPDVEVEYDPQLVRAGHDPQLERAVEIVLAALKKNPLPIHKKPAYPNYQQAGGKATQISRP
jgi:tricorn protease